MTQSLGSLLLVLFLSSATPALSLAQSVDSAQHSFTSGARVALVIGNSAYDRSPLRNPVSDARAMADTLTRLGFRVTLRTDVDLAHMVDAMEQFTREGRNDDVRLFFYAGHGVQFRGRNYLVPVGATIDAPEEIPAFTADLQQLIDRMQRAAKGVNVIILDACRTYPMLARSGVRTRGIQTPAGEGLAQVSAPSGTLIAFSTAPGAVARDGASGHSVYARHLLSNLEIPGLTIEQLFKRVRTAVLNDTDQSQVPWENSSLTGDFCFRPGRRGRCPGS